jgi:hypothetical protein
MDTVAYKLSTQWQTGGRRDDCLSKNKEIITSAARTIKADVYLFCGMFLVVAASFGFGFAGRIDPLPILGLEM